MNDISRSEARIARSGKVAGGSAQESAYEVFEGILAEGLYIEVGRLKRWVRAHPGCRDALFRLAYGLRHVPRPGSGGELTASEVAEVRRVILAEVEAHDRRIQQSATGVRALFDPIPAWTLLGAFVKQRSDERTETTLRWCRTFPDVAFQIIEAASVLALGAMGRPPGAAAPKEEDSMRRERLLARAQAILNAEKQGAIGTDGAAATTA